MLSRAFHNRIYAWGLPLLLFLMPFNTIACNIIILVLSTNWLAELDFRNKFSRLLRSPYVILCLCWFALICLELLNTYNIKAGHFATEKKLSLLCFPLVIGTSSFFHHDEKIRATCYRFFCLGTLAASMVLLLIACYQFMLSHDAGCFFYHRLVSPFSQHAVYFSVYVYISIVFIFNNMRDKAPATWQLAALLFLSAVIILLSSKLMIFMFLLHGLIVLIKRLASRRKKIYTYLALLAVLFVSAFIFLTKNPVKERFSDLANGNMALLKQEKYEPSNYFNAWQLRILLWKFSFSMLDGHKAWLAGVTPGDAQDLLNAEVRRHNMYIGDKQRKDYGYLHHNCHNQYIETMLQTGIPGLLLLLSILFLSFREALRHKDQLSLFAVFIFSYFFLTESALERMIGIVPFFIFLSLLHTKRYSKP